MDGALQENKKYTYAEFLEITKDMERAEFIDGQIILQVTPTLQHQGIVGNLLFEFKTYFKGNTCKPFIAPFDIILQNKNEEPKVVQPDLFVLCSNFDTTKNEFNGVPTLVIEVISPSNSGNDFVTKLNLYQKYAVPEYWIVSPKNKSVQIFVFDKEIKMYNEPFLYSKDDVVSSSIFNNLSMELKSIFD